MDSVSKDDLALAIMRRTSRAQTFCEKTKEKIRFMARTSFIRDILNDAYIGKQKPPFWGGLNFFVTILWIGIAGYYLIALKLFCR